MPKRSRPQGSIKVDIVILHRMSTTSEDTSTPVYTLITDKLQPMSVNVLIRLILNIRISQGSVATRLRCGGIFNDQFFAQSLLSLLSVKVENF